MCFILNVHIIFYIKTHESWVITLNGCQHAGIKNISLKTKFILKIKRFWEKLIFNHLQKYNLISNCIPANISQ